MNTFSSSCLRVFVALTSAGVVAGALNLSAQQPPGAPQAPQTPKAAAPIDLTGYWVSVVTEDWRWRMLTPPKGDYTSVPLNPEGRKTADSWDPSKAAANGCKPYGAAAIMRAPGRIHLTWESDNVLKIETDAGQQTRRLLFDRSLKPAGPSILREPQDRPEQGRETTGSGQAEKTWQGFSIAEWDVVGGRGGRGAAPQPRDGALKVVTTNMRAGYLRKNGVPYSESAVLTEYYDRHTDFGTEWITVTSILEDPQYLTQPFITSTHFKREADGSKWSATPCE